MSASDSDADVIDTTKISSITPSIQVRDLINLQTQKLLNRLFQEVDDQNNLTDALNTKFSELSIKSNIDYQKWSSKSPNLTTPNNPENDFLPDVLNENQSTNTNKEDADKERETLLYLLHREKKLSNHYESLLESYEKLLTATAVSARERREETFGVYNDDDDDDESPPSKDSKLAESIHSLQLTKSLQTKATALKHNSEMLESLRNTKNVEFELVKSTLIKKAEKFAQILDQDDDNSNNN